MYVMHIQVNRGTPRVFVHASPRDTKMGSGVRTHFTHNFRYAYYHSFAKLINIQTYLGTCKQQHKQLKRFCYFLYK